MRINEVFSYQVIPSVYASHANNLKSLKKIEQEDNRKVEPVIPIRNNCLEYETGRFLDVRV